MDWPRRTDEIQKRFFRDGLYTHLCIQVMPVNADSNHGNHCIMMVSWTFSFMDFGMHHTITGNSLVLEDHEERGYFWVDNHPLKPENDALQHAFGGHYQEFMDELYSEFLTGWA